MGDLGRSVRIYAIDPWLHAAASACVFVQPHRHSQFNTLTSGFLGEGASGAREVALAVHQPSNVPWTGWRFHELTRPISKQGKKEVYNQMSE
jgi:hypothetical protein